MALLQQIIEPKKLLLVWQRVNSHKAGETHAGRRYIVGELLRGSGGQVVLHYLKDTKDFEDATAKGFEGHPAFSIEQERHEINVMDAFQRRLPPRTRRDFDDYLLYHGIDPAVKGELSEFALLGYTGGKLPSDGFSLVHTYE